MTSSPTLGIDLGTGLHVWKAGTPQKVYTKHEACILNGYGNLKNLNQKL